MTLVDLLRGPAGSKWMEGVALMFTVGFLWLLAKQSPWGWPLGILGCLIYTAVFFDASLYADMTLQIILSAQLAYGWWYSRSARRDLPAVRVKRLSAREWAAWLAAGATGGTLYGTVLHRFSNASMPFVDANLAAFSVIAQWLQARRVIDNWILWILIDGIYAGVYWVKDLKPTVALMVLLAILAVNGYVRWHRSETVTR